MASESLEIAPGEIMIADKGARTLMANLRICSAVTLNVEGKGGALIHVSTIHPFREIKNPQSDGPIREEKSVERVRKFQRELHTGEVCNFRDVTAHELLLGAIARLMRTYRVKKSEITVGLHYGPTAHPSSDYLEDALRKMKIKTNIVYGVSHLEFHPGSGVSKLNQKFRKMGPFLFPEF